MSHYAITQKPTFYGDIRSINIPPKHYESMYEDLSEHAEEARGNTIKKLKGCTYLWRYRIGDYRIIYSVRGSVVELLAAGMRRDVYKRFYYNPENPDENLLKEKEAELYPNSALAQEVANKRNWSQHLIYKDQQCEAELRQRQELAERLPKTITSEMLTQWRIPTKYHTILEDCKTVTDLLNAPAKDVPDKIVEIVMNRMIEKDISEIALEPTFLLNSARDLVRYVQGEISNFLLKLDDTQKELVDWRLQGPTMLKGGPGTGKSTVALYRVHKLLENAFINDQEPPRILFTTYTNALVNVSQELLEQLLTKDFPENYRRFATAKTEGNIHVTTVDALARRMAEPLIKNRQIVSNAWKNALQEVRTHYTPSAANSLERAAIQRALERLDNSYLADEIETIIEGRGLESLEAYLSTDRSGRGQPLQANARRIVWELYLRAKDQLEKKKHLTWGQIRLMALEQASKQTPMFDHVIIDETQDLTPVALRLCVEVVKDKQNIFLAADLSQSIYNRRFSFSDVHQALNIAGRSRILRRNYRTTAEIMAGAAEIIKDTTAGDTETLQQECVKFGQKPTLVIAQDTNDHVKAVVRYIYDAALDLRLPLGAAAILCPSSKLAREIAEQCQQFGLPAKYMESSSVKLEAPEVKVLTMHTAKGLEFPIVVLPFVNEGILPRHLAEASPDDPQEFENSQRRVFYVAATRAMRRLLITTGANAQFSKFCAGFSERYWHFQTV